MVAPNITVTAPTPIPAEQGSPSPDVALIETFNSQLREAKLEALGVLQNLLYLDSDKDIAIHTQKRLAATAILRVKELKPPKLPREPRVKSAKPKRTPSPMPRSLSSLDTAALNELAHRAFAPESDFRPMDKIRLARQIATEHARQARAEMKAQRAQARASLRRPDS